MAVIAVDFDDTLFGYDEEKHPVILDGAREALVRLKAAGHTIVIHSARVGLAMEKGGVMARDREIGQIEKILDHHSVPFDDIFEGRKLVADIYIDDRAVAFEGNWPDTLRTTLARCESEE